VPRNIGFVDLTDDSAVNQRAAHSKRALLDEASKHNSKNNEAGSKRHKLQQQADEDFDELIIVADTGKVVWCSLQATAWVAIIKMLITVPLTLCADPAERPEGSAASETPVWQPCVL
jgi:hypothetical protein